MSATDNTDNGTKMHAVVCRRYGGPEVLEYTEIDRPEPGEGEVLVQVRAASINAADYRLMRADPFLARFAAGLLRPTRTPVLGRDLAGVVVAVGPGVTDRAVGDEVFGYPGIGRVGTFAEYVGVAESNVVPVPDGLGFDGAAAVPLAGITALQAVRDLGEVGPGRSILVQGAGGGVGLFVVQIARARGAEVTAVCGAGSAGLVAAAGADRVIDYAREDFAAEGHTYDVIIGVNGHRSLADYRRCLADGGRYVMVGGTNRQIFEAALLGRLRFVGRGKSVRVLTIDDDRRAADLRELAQLLAEGALRPAIDRTFPLADTAEAMRYVEQGHVKGKVIVTVG